MYVHVFFHRVRLIIAPLMLKVVLTELLQVCSSDVLLSLDDVYVIFRGDLK